jgi:hypothetical protein
MQREILGFWFRYESGEPHSEQKFPGSVVDPHFEQATVVDITTISSTGLSSVGTVITRRGWLHACILRRGSSGSGIFVDFVRQVFC